MKFVRLLLLLPLAAFAFGASPPPAVSGLVYYEVGSTFVRSAFSIGLVLGQDGTFRTFCESSSSGFPSSSGDTIPTQFLSGTREGRWLYRLVDEKTAELDFGSEFGSRRLTFTDSSSGTFLGSPGPRTGVFRFASQSNTPPLVNCSNRSFLAAGRSVIAGFVVSGERRHVLIRAIGPGLTRFGVSRPLASPVLRVQNGKGVFSENDGWEKASSEAVLRTSTLAGAFPLSTSSQDAAVIVTLPSGAYTAEAFSSNPGTEGEVLVEIYMLP